MSEIDYNYDKFTWSRQESIGDCLEILTTNTTNISNVGNGKSTNGVSYDDTVRHLDIYYGIVKRQLLRFQSPTTGMFPAFSTETRIASVRESLYCSAAIWSLFQAYRRIDDDRGKSYELGQSVVKCLRGILRSWILQAPRVETFKQNQCSKNSALHCKFDLNTGDVILDDEKYFHLQIDVVSLYLIFLVQMISSGLQIIYTHDEINFVQNLVYYVERAYRTPDYGMWERGSKYNDGIPEIHASSIGMAKAALESINGCNLFGDKGDSKSIIYVDIDAHNRNRSIFETLIPRESCSKNIDVSLLPTISFPAFATHDESLYSKTKNEILSNLKGEYGFKRFLRDGYKTQIEKEMISDSDSDCKKRFYEKGETKDFENIESEWPLFYLFLIIDGVFKQLPDQVEEYSNLLGKRILRDAYGDPIIPMCYYVTKESSEYERQEPGSQLRFATSEGSAKNIFLWGQAMYIIAKLLVGGLIHVQEIDIIRRHLPAYNRPRKIGGRYSAFQPSASETVVQIVLIAESMRLQAMMNTYGINTQTPHEVEPVQIWPPSQLVKLYEKLGVNKKLKLGGRPPRPIGSLGTSKIYRMCAGKTVLCYPLIFEVSDFYLSHDLQLLIDDIKNELIFVGKYWKLSGRPTMCLLIREEHMRDRKFKEMLDLFAMLKKGHCDGQKVRLGRLQNLLSSSCIEHLDFMKMIPEEIIISPFSQVHEYIGYQSLTDVPKAIILNEPNHDFTTWKNSATWEIVEAFRALETASYYGKCQLLEFLLKREGPDFLIDGRSIQEHLIIISHECGALRLWGSVRYASSLLCQLVDSISPYITTILVNGKQLTFGVIGKEETEIIFDMPMTPEEIKRAMYTKIQPFDVLQAVVQQEVALYCGKLITTNPELFNGILMIRIGWILRAINLYMQIIQELNENETSPTTFKLESCSPSEVRKLLKQVLTINISDTCDSKINLKLSVFQRRQIEGCLCRVPENFYYRVWHILKKTPGGIILPQGNILPQEPTITQYTPSEVNFSFLVEKLLHNISKPEMIQIVIELLCVVSTILQRNPELSFRGVLNVDKMINGAFKMFQKDFIKLCQKNMKITELDNDFQDQLKSHNSDLTYGIGEENLNQSQSQNELIVEMSTFFNCPTSISTGYLARACVNDILKGDMGLLSTSSGAGSQDISFSSANSNDQEDQESLSSANSIELCNIS